MFSDVLLVGGVSLATAMTLFLLLRLSSAKPAPHPAPAEEDVSLLFEDGILHQGSAAALTLFGFRPGLHFWDDLRAALEPRFPDLPDQANQSATGTMAFATDDPNDPAQIKMRWENRLCWVDLSGFAPRQPATHPHLPALQTCADTVDHAVWEVARDGTITWHNPAYAALRNSFAEEPAKLLSLPAAEERKRIALSTDETGTSWFDVHRHPLGDGHLFHAACITPLVTAEETQHRFVQTLAKTFAHLSVGLAIFGKDGRLNIFNPALVDLTHLDPKFLVSQPSMQSFFDQLRETRQMPEPRTYSAWRQEIAAMISAAADGNYHERWTLEDGRTYIIQGRPHPDGAIAFMIEDISFEVTLTHSFRTEVAQFEALLDAVEDPLAVFSISGVLTFCNAAYRDYWKQNPESAFADITLQDAIDVWQERATAEVDWQWMISGTATLGKRESQSESWAQTDGSQVTCTLQPVAPDATAVRFRITAPQPAKAAIAPA